MRSGQTVGRNSRNEAIDADDVIIDHCVVDCYGAGIFVDVKRGVCGMKDLCRRFFYEETAVGVVEMILILVVLIGLVIIFKQQLTSIVNSIFKKITSQSNSI